MEEKEIKEQEIKIDQETLFQINQIQKSYNQNAMNIGITKQKMFNLEEALSELKNNYMTINKQNNEIRQQITNKYGNGTIDLDKGIFIKNSK